MHVIHMSRRASFRAHSESAGARFEGSDDIGYGNRQDAVDDALQESGAQLELGGEAHPAAGARLRLEGPDEAEAPERSLVRAHLDALRPAQDRLGAEP